MARTEFLIFTLMVTGAFLWLGFNVWAHRYRPDWSERLLRLGKTRLSPWTLKPEADIYLRLFAYLMFFVFSALMCFVIYSWIAIAAIGS